MERPIYAYTYLDEPFGDAAQLLISDPQRLLQAATDEAAQDAHELAADLHLDLGSFEIGRDIIIQLGEAKLGERNVVSIPITWHAEDASGLFPALEASIELQALSFTRPLTQLTLVGSYEPPLGVVGAIGDAIAGHHIAEAVAHRFVDELANRFTELLAEAREDIPVSNR